MFGLFKFTMYIPYPTAGMLLAWFCIGTMVLFIWSIWKATGVRGPRYRNVVSSKGILWLVSGVILWPWVVAIMFGKWRGY